MHMSNSSSEYVDQALRTLGCGYKRDIIITTELRLARAIHLTNTDLILAEDFYPERLAALQRKMNELIKLKTLMEASQC